MTVEYSDDGTPLRITTIVVSTQHDEFDTDDSRMFERIKDDVKNILMPRVKEQIHSEKVLALFNDGIEYRSILRASSSSEAPTETPG